MERLINEGGQRAKSHETAADQAQTLTLTAPLVKRVIGEVGLRVWLRLWLRLWPDFDLLLIVLFTTPALVLGI